MQNESYVSGLPKFKQPSSVNKKTLAENANFQKLIEKNTSFLDGLGKNRMYDAVIEAQEKRKIKIGSKWLIDYASCNYLGFDLDKEIMESIPEMIEKWGTHPSWSRMLGSPIVYEELEEKLAELLGVETCIALPCLTLIHHYSIFIFSEGGEIFLDKRSHRTMYEGAVKARGLGAKVTYFSSDELGQLELLLKMSKSHKKLICIDGVFSMHGQYADIPSYAALARQYDALLYVDDAHGFGVVGERSEFESSPYGMKGNAIVKHFGENYDNIIFTVGFSKAYSSPVSFICCNREQRRFLKATAVPYLYTGPVSVSTLATALKSLEVNEKRGDIIRADLYRKCEKFNDAINNFGFRNDNNTNFPIFNLYLENPDHLDLVSNYLFENGIYVTLAPYPMVAKNDVGFRIQITAPNTDEEIEYTIGILEKLNNMTPFQKRGEFIP